MTPAATASWVPSPQAHQIRALLSTLWIYVLLSMLFRDMHEILREGFVAELAASGTVRGDEVTEATLVVSGFFLQLPLAMVVAARYLPFRWNRPANVVVAVVTALGQLVIWPKDGDDLVFGFFQVVGLAAIVFISTRMLRVDEPSAIAQ